MSATELENYLRLWF